MFTKVRRHIRYILQFLPTLFLHALFFLLPFKWASAAGGKIAALIGPKLKVSNIARDNLQRVFPSISTDHREKIVVGMWENLGRTIAEYHHMSKIDMNNCHHIEIINSHIIDELRDDQQPALLFLGHIANWEYATFPALKKGLRITQLYRKLNNPYVAWTIGRIHEKIVQDVVEKSAQGVKKMLAVLKQGGHISMLIDQKLSNGMSVPFLGIDAMSPTALAKLALKFQCPIIPIRVERIKGVSCRVTYFPALKLPTEGTWEQKVYQITRMANDMLSDWIRAKPEDWMWIHNRWPK